MTGRQMIASEESSLREESSIDSRGQDIHLVSEFDRFYLYLGFWIFYDSLFIYWVVIVICLLSAVLLARASLEVVLTSWVKF